MYKHLSVIWIIKSVQVLISICAGAGEFVILDQYHMTGN